MQVLQAVYYLVGIIHLSIQIYKAMKKGSKR